MENSYLSQLNEGFNTFVSQNLPPKDVAGMDVHTGKWLGLNAHIEQQLQDLILTPRGVTLMYPNYGSAMMYYMDMPVSAVGMDLKIEVSKVVKEFETRIIIINTAVSLSTTTGKLNLNIEYSNNNGEVNNINV